MSSNRKAPRKWLHSVYYNHSFESRKENDPTIDLDDINYSWSIHAITLDADRADPSPTTVPSSSTPWVIAFQRLSSDANFGTGITPLRFAVVTRRYDLIEFLVREMGACLKGTGALREAAHQKDLHCIRLLISLNATLDQSKDETSDKSQSKAFTLRDKRDALVAAASSHEIENCSTLLSFCCPKEILNGSDALRSVLACKLVAGDALFSAVASDDVKMCQMLLEYGIDPAGFVQFNSNRKGKTPIHVASQNGNLRLVKYLVMCGADFEVKNDMGATPLHFAALNCHEETCRYLLTLGANHSVKDYSLLGETPVDWTQDPKIRILLETACHICDTAGLFLQNSICFECSWNMQRWMWIAYKQRDSPFSLLHPRVIKEIASWL